MEEPALATAISNRQVWDKMLKYFEKSPFVYDVMSNCSVRFNETEWTLVFAPGKEFYQIPAQNKLAELERMAKEFSGRIIHIKLGVEPAVTTVTSSKKTTACAAKKETQEPISNEEPFVNASFEQDVLIAPAVTVNAPEEVKEI